MNFSKLKFYDDGRGKVEAIIFFKNNHGALVKQGGGTWSRPEHDTYQLEALIALKPHPTGRLGYDSALDRSIIDMSVHQTRDQVERLLDEIAALPPRSLEDIPESVVYEVHPLDVWGNERDGYEMNDVWPSRGQIEVPEDASHDDIVRALKREGFIDRNIHMRSVGIDGEVGYELYIHEARTHKPVYELRVAAR